MAEKEPLPSSSEIAAMSDSELDSLMKINRKRRDVGYYFTHNNRGHSKQGKVQNKPLLEVGSASVDVDADLQERKFDEQCDESDIPLHADVVNYELKLNEEMSYAHMLANDQAIVFTQFAIYMCRQMTDLRLNRSSYVAIIQLCGKLYCSCCDELEKAMTCCALSIAPSLPNKCSHLDVLPMFAGYDDIEEWIYPEDRHDHGYSDGQQCQVIAVSSIAMVAYYDRAFATVVGNKCDCRGHTGSCMFVKLCKEESVEAEKETVIMSRQSALSWNPIPFVRTSLNNSQCDTVRPVQCQCGSEDITTSNQAITLPMFGFESVGQCLVYKGVCNVCEQPVYADGGNEHVLNMGTYVVSHRLLQQYAMNFVTTGLTLYSYFKMRCWDWRLDGHNMGTHMTYNQLRLAWMSYLDLVDLGYCQQEEAFQCPVCSKAPEIVICDGITLSFQRRFLTTHRTANQQTTKLAGCWYENRVLIVDFSLRKRIQNLAVVDTELILLADSLEPWLAIILRQFEGLRIDELSKPWRGLLRDVSSSTSALGLVDAPLSTVAMLKQLRQVDNAEKLSFLKDFLPSLYLVIREDTSVIDVLQPLLQHLVDKVEHVLSFHAHKLAPMTESCFDNSLACFPALPQLVERGSYVADKSTSKVCNKKSQKHRTLTPGIFTVSCPHGICYGFTIMEKHESANMPFTILRTRFRQAPSLVIYDNACNLHDYCLNRDPGFFKHTKFCVDRFHWYNHKDCSSGYNIRAFAKFSSTNTQVAEQVNSKLATLRGLLSYCNEVNFKRQVMLFLWYSNTMNILHFRPANNDVEHCLEKLKDLYVKK